MSYPNLLKYISILSIILCSVLFSSCGDNPGNIIFDNPLDPYSNGDDVQASEEPAIPDSADTDPVVTKLTTDPGVDSMPTWSPDGKTIAYISNSSGGKSQIWSIVATGGTPIQLTDDSYGASEPEYSPDGDRILYTTKENIDSGVVGIWSIPVSGGHRVKVFKGDWANDYAAAWSPDADEIVFISERGASGPGGQNVWIVSSDGGGDNLRSLTDGNTGDGDPDWNSDGSTIAFSSTTRSGNGDIWTIPAAGGDPTNLTDTPRWHEDQPAYSPDGKWLAFRSDRSGNWGIWIMPASGGEASMVVDYNTGTVSTPTWSPDGTMIVFDAGNSDDRDLWVASNIPYP